MTRHTRLAKPDFRLPDRHDESTGSDILVLLPFDPDTYGPRVAAIFAYDGNVRDLLLKADARDLFPGARDPESALSGLFLYFFCLSEAHELLHRFTTVDSAYWHGIMHRMEGDAWNAGYWFRRVGRHPVFPALHKEAAELGYAHGDEWDPFAFIQFCETSVRRKDDVLAKRVQLAEWQLLFEYCATATTSRMAAR